jgi:hypothetical protein
VDRDSRPQGKCVDPDAERRKAERLAIQTGSDASEKGVTFSNGVQGLIERSIRNEELANGGAPLSEERKAEIAAKVRALAPSDEVRYVMRPFAPHHAVP